MASYFTRQDPELNAVYDDTASVCHVPRETRGDGQGAGGPE